MTPKLLMLCVLLLALSMRADADVTFKRADYHGWPDACYLSNGTVELVFVPQIGRVMRYGYVGGSNLLWENPALAGKVTDINALPADWPNYGGDKLWPAPQNRWGWPPDPMIDSAPQTVKVLAGNRLLVTGQASKKHGVRFQREIVLAATGTEVTFKNAILNTTDAPVSWSIWQVTQVDSPDLVRMPLHRGGRFPKGYYVFDKAGPQPDSLRLTDKEMHLRRNSEHSSKVGGDSPLGVLTAHRGDLRFEVSTKVQPSADYPDDGCALEIYTNPDPNRYVELELLGPITNLTASKSSTFITRWRLSRVAKP